MALVRRGQEVYLRLANKEHPSSSRDEGLSAAARSLWTPFDRFRSHLAPDSRVQRLEIGYYVGPLEAMRVEKITNYGIDILSTAGYPRATELRAVDIAKIWPLPLQSAEPADKIRSRRQYDQF